MLKLCKIVLRKVSFDHYLFQKEYVIMVEKYLNKKRFVASKATFVK